MGEEKEMTETQNASTETFAHRQTAPVAPPLLSAQEALVALVNHAVAASLIDEQDVIWATNQIAHLIGFEEAPALDEASLEKIELPEDGYSTLPEGYTLQGILDILTKAAVENGVIEQGSVSADLLDTKITSVFTLPPSKIFEKFCKLYLQSPSDATDWFFQFCKDINYVRQDRLNQNLSWQTETPYGPLDITINLSKPEKDPKAIAAALKSDKIEFPKCMLCLENEGYAGRMDYPARDNLRIIPLELLGEKWGFQYSPYGYFNEHCILLCTEHRPMKINFDAFRRLLEIVTRFPTYFVGSNADLPVVGGSILTHDHYQGGKYIFPMDRAEAKDDPRATFFFEGFPDIKAEYIKWPMSTIRLSGLDKERVAELAAAILNAWRGYSDEEAGIVASSENPETHEMEPHNTITSIARNEDGTYIMNLVLRCNITSDEFPLGVFHPHPEYHHVKKENIGLIEVMGLAILPPRLKEEVEKGSLTRDEIGEIFSHVLEDAGVYKDTPEGNDQFFRFVEAVNEKLKEEE